MHHSLPKVTNSIATAVLVWAVVSSTSPPTEARADQERYLFSGGEVWITEGSGMTRMTQNVALENHITVITNGTFKVGLYPPRTFVEGQILSANGMLLSPDGRIEPVFDHVAMAAGKSVASINAEESTVSRDLLLGDKRLTSDRVLLGNDGSWMRVLDGQLFTLEGKTIPPVDTISLQQGKVVVQKEGAQIAVDGGRTIMMNEGTKVFGNGILVSRDGRVTELREGEIIAIEGVIKRR